MTEPKLTTWLAGIEREGLGLHATLPRLPENADISTPDAGCVGCALASTAGHETVGCFTAADAAPADTRVVLRDLVRMQYLVWRLHVDAMGLYGSEEGFLINAASSFNYADATTWRIVECGLGDDGNELLLEAPEGVDPRFLTLAQGPKGRGKFGVIQPGFRVRYNWPSILHYKSEPMVTAVVSCDPETRQIRIRVEQVTSAAKTSGDPDDLTPAAYHCELWVQAGDPFRFMPVNPPSPCVARCAHAKRDWTNSIAAYGTEAGQGVGVDTDGNHWYCRKAPETEEAFNEGEDQWDYDFPLASRVADFPADGQCALTDCDGYERGCTAAVDLRPWETRRHFARFLWELWASVAIRVDQGMPGFSTIRNWSIVTIHAPSLMSLVGNYSLQSPIGMHATSFFPGFGMFCRATTVVVDEETGEQDLRLHFGWDHDASTPKDDVQHADDETWPAAGHYPALVEDFTDQPDELDYPDLLDDVTDAGVDLRRQPERMGPLLERDTGARAGRHPARWGHMEPAEGVAIIPNVSTTDTSGPQGREFGTFRRLAAPVSMLGKTIGGYVEFHALRQAAKEPESIGTRTVRAVTNLGGGLFAIDFENETHRWSYTEVVGPGNSHDRVLEWKGGGSWPMLPRVHARIDSWYELNKYLGSTRGGATRGDTIRFAGTIGGVDFTGRRFLLSLVSPHGGEAAADWGDTRAVVESFRLGGAWVADPDNTVAGSHEIGGQTVEYRGAIEGWTAASTETKAPGDNNVFVTPKASVAAGMIVRNARTDELMRITAVVYASVGMTLGIDRGVAGSTAANIIPDDEISLEMVTEPGSSPADQPWTRVEGETLPALSAGQYWVDERENLIRWAPADDGEIVDVRYTVDGQAVESAAAYADEDFTIPAWAEYTTDIPWADWTARLSESLRYAETDEELTYGAGDPGAAGAWTAIDSSGVVKVRCHLGDAAAMVVLRIELADAADEPSDGVCIGCSDYTAFGKNTDRAVVIDQGGFLEAAGSALEGEDVIFEESAGGFSPGAVLEVTEFEEDDWAGVSAEDMIEEAGTGVIWLTDDYLGDLPEDVCWKGAIPV